MAEPEIDMDGLVEAGARALYNTACEDIDRVPWGRLHDAVRTPFRDETRAILTAVLPLVLAGPARDLRRLVDAKALSGVREQVAGWNGENLPEPYKERHPNKLGATLPKTNCGAVYELDEAMQSARSTLTRIEALLKDESRGEG